MKFLITLAVLVSSTAFAQMNRERIRCFEPANQGERGDLVYVLEERGMGNQVLHVVFPEGFPNPLRLDNDGCLEHPSQGPGPSDELTLCPGQGQRIRGLVPVEATEEGEGEETVYCEREILDWFEL